MSAGTYNPTKVSIKIDGREIGFDKEGFVVADGEVLPVARSFAVSITFTEIVHTKDGYQHQHALLEDGRLGPATHFKKTTT